MEEKEPQSLRMKKGGRGLVLAFDEMDEESRIGICRSDTQGLKNFTTLRTNRLHNRTEREVPRNQGSRSGNRPCRIFV